MHIRFLFKLLAGFGLIGLIMVFITSLAIKTIYDSSALLSRTIETQVSQLATVNRLQFQAHKIRLQEAELSKLTDVFATTGAIQQLRSETESFTTELEAFVRDVSLKNETDTPHLFDQWRFYVQDQRRTIRQVQELNFGEAQEISTYFSRPRFQTFSQGLKTLSSRIEKRARDEHLAAQSSLRSKHRSFLMISLGGIGLGVIFALLLSHSLSTRLRALRRGAMLLAEGKLKDPVKVEGGDEVADLAETFNLMHVRVQSREDELRRAQSELEERVIERTWKLRQANLMLSEKSDLLDKVARGVSARIGEDFFFSLARHLTEALGADYVLTGEFDEDEAEKIDSIAIWSQGGAIENMPCDLEGTPSRHVLNEGTGVYPREVRSLFPDDAVLKELEVDAYVGIALRRTDGSPLGILAALFRKPLDKQEETLSLLQIFGARAAAELERRHADRILQESEERFRSMVQTSPDAVVLVELATKRIVDVNEGFTAITGYSHEEAIGRSSLEIGIWHDPADRERMYELLDRDGQVTNMEIRSRMKNGESSIGLLSARIIQLGNEPHMLVVARDINKIKSAQKALEKSEHRFRELYQQFEALLDGISDALVLFSPKLEVVWANRGAARLFGYDYEELEGMSCRSFWCKSIEQCSEGIRSCFDSGEAVELMDRTPDGRCWGIKTFPIKDGSGGVENVIQIISDITEKTRLREQATRASRLASLGELAAGVAHEINNPNAQIRLNLPIILEAVEDSLPLLEEHYRRHGDFTWAGLDFSRMRGEVPGLIAEMRDASNRIRNIVEDLKHFSRQERPDRMQPVDLNKAVATAVRLTRNTIKRATTRFDVEYDDALPPVNGIEQRLEQVLVNLIINACEALPERSRRISLRTRYDEDRRRCRVLVSDEGIGMSENELCHITDPFFTTRRETGGTGLGLSIAQRIIKEHGGELLFESAPDEGTTVTIELPVKH